MIEIKTLKRAATVVCPVCMEEFNVEIYRVINEGEFKDFHPQNINKVNCPYCGNSFRVGERVLLYYPKENIIFFVYPDEDEDERLLRTTFRELKSILKDLKINVPEMVMVVGWERFIIMWEILSREDLLNFFLEKYVGGITVFFYKKLEQLAQIYQEYIEDLSQLGDPEIREIVKKRFDNIVDI